MKGKTLKRMRRRTGLTQAQIAKIMNVTQQAINYDETHDIRNMDRIQAYARIFHCDWKDLVD